ncbi:MAG: UpxY family transcription antiterminator [Niabella sp.]
MIYTKPRWEKKVAQLLTERDIETYCPLNRVKKKWSDRIKKVEIPLFTSYVFVNIREDEKGTVRETDGVINFIYANRKPAIVKQKEIEKIKRFLSEYEDIEVMPGLIRKDQTVYINTGLFVDEKGRVVDLQNNKVKVEIESLGYTLTATFDISELSPGPDN